MNERFAGAFCASAAALLLLAAGCDGGPFGPRACTLIGCYSGLEVELAGTLPDEYTVSARVGGYPAWMVECSPARPCGPTVFFPEFTPDHVIVTVTGEGLDVRREFRPEYRSHRPNGSGCPPECRTAKVRVDTD